VRGGRGGGGAFHEAALDAAAGRLWPVERVVGEPLSDRPLAATQRRAVARSGALLGLAGSERQGEAIAALLGVDGLDHQRARALWASGRRRRTCGQAVGAVLAALPSDEQLSLRLLAAGQRVGLWGEAVVIDPLSGRRHGVLCRPPPTTFALSRLRWGS